MIGEKHMNTFVGKHIYDICKLPNVNTILDIGTSNGLGTTKCAVNAIIETKKSNYLIYSIDCRPGRIQLAINNLPNIQNLFIKHGTIILHTELLGLLDTLEWGDGRETALRWLRDDIEFLKTTTYIMDEIPEKLDLLIIDGGEFSGYLEFKKLYERSLYIILDDTNSYKNKKSRQFILDNKDMFVVLVDEQNCLVCKKCK